MGRNRYPLFLIYRKSLQCRKVPADWKLAEVTTVHKKGLKSDRSNYRPVSLTSICCKIFESLIRDHIMSYLLENDLLSTKQYGFIKGWSTMLQLLHIVAVIPKPRICLSWGLPPCQVAASSIQQFDRNKHGPKIWGFRPPFGDGEQGLGLRS